MTTRAGQWHTPYNPVTHQGEGGPISGRAKGVKITHKEAGCTGSLHGTACIPKETASPASPTNQVALPTHGAAARVDHLRGVACVPCPGASSRSGQCDDSGNSDGGPKSPTSRHPANLRASIDHLSGEACSVRPPVKEVATADVVFEVPSRGMATKLTKDRMVAQEARERQQASKLYHPGQGYTPVGQEAHQLAR